MNSNSPFSRAQRISRKNQRRPVESPVSVVASGTNTVRMRLRCLTDRDGGDDAVLERVDHRDAICVFKPDIETCAIARGP